MHKTFPQSFEDVQYIFVSSLGAVSPPSLPTGYATGPCHKGCHFMNSMSAFIGAARSSRCVLIGYAQSPLIVDKFRTHFFT